MSYRFLSGNEAVAEGVRLARPHVISAYPITPQTTVVETLSQMVADEKLKTEYVHVESEHSALSCAIGASAIGARTFTATSSQGLLYLAEGLQYAAGGRFPILMMNANRALALPWNIYGDQSDSISQLDSGWIQIYVEDAQEALDMVLQGYYIGEHKHVSTPVMLNLDGFQLTHTYEKVHIPTEDEADRYLPKYETENKLDLNSPKNLGFSVGPAYNQEFKTLQHKGVLETKKIVEEADKRFKKIFGRSHGGLVEPYKCEDAEHILLSLGSVSGICKETVDILRDKGEKVGFLKIRFLRPFPGEEIINIIKKAKSIGVLEQAISFGNRGTVYTNVAAEIAVHRLDIESTSYVGGLGGRDITTDNILEIYSELIDGRDEDLRFVGKAVEIDV